MNEGFVKNGASRLNRLDGRFYFVVNYRTAGLHTMEIRRIRRCIQMAIFGSNGLICWFYYLQPHVGQLGFRCHKCIYADHCLYRSGTLLAKPSECHLTEKWVSRL